MNTDIEDTVKSSLTWLGFQQTEPNDKVIPHKIPGKIFKVIGTDLLTMNSNKFHCVVDYCSRFPVDR